MNFKYLTIFLLLFTLTSFGAEQVADSGKVNCLVFVGNNKTKDTYLRKFVQCDEGNYFDSLKISEDKRQLRNLPSILEVEHFVVDNDSGFTLIYQITERLTIIPIGEFGVSDDYYYFGLGAMETNAFGRGIYFLGFYRFSHQHSFQLISKIPYILGSKFGLHAQAYLWNTEETIYMNENQTDYTYNYFDLQLLLRYEFSNENCLHAGYINHFDEYALIDTNLTATWDAEMYNNYSGIKLIHLIEHLDNRYFIVEGWSNLSIIEYRIPHADYHPEIYWKESIKYYKKLGAKGNYCSRFEIGFSSNQKDPFSDFTLSDYDNLRGVGYNAYRGSSLISLSNEYRFTLFQRKLLGSQLVAFADAANVLEYKQDLADLFTPNNFKLFAGLGYRLVFIEAHNAVIGIDYGINTSNINDRGFVLRWGQFF